MSDYGYAGFVSYSDTGGSTGSSGSSSGTMSTTDTDDGFFDPGDAADDTRGFGQNQEYVGSFTTNGHVFLVFESTIQPGFHRLFSPTASAASGSSDFPTTYTDGDFTLDTAPFAVCFAQGTEIETESGAQPIETLAIGDLIRTVSGGLVPVKWIGKQTLVTALWDPRLQPVRIRAGALGRGLPYADLTVTADHGMVFYASNRQAVGIHPAYGSEAMPALDNGMVVNASALVNGDTITFVPVQELAHRFTVYHIETEAHDVILANGAPSETFVDAVTRSHFDNYQQYLDLYGADRIIPEIAMPRIASARLLPQEIRDWLGQPRPGRPALNA